jgi:hypothetical protein
MHDPLTVAFQIKYPWKNKNNYRSSVITIWHRDPESDGTDDSQGWFIRSRHCDKNKIKKTINDYDFEWDKDYGGWFNKDGSPRLSVIAITLNMFSIAAYHHLGTWKKSNNFMNKNLYNLIRFAENNIDSLHDYIVGQYGFEDRDARIERFANIVYPFVARETRPWFKHPRWQFWRWLIQFHPWQNLRRKYWDKCCKCGKRGFKKSAMGNWSGTQIWHEECDNTQKERN